MAFSGKKTPSKPTQNKTHLKTNNTKKPQKTQTTKPLPMPQTPYVMFLLQNILNTNPSAVNHLQLEANKNIQSKFIPRCCLFELCSLKLTKGVKE